MLAKPEYFKERQTVAMPHRMLVTGVRPSFRKEPEKVSATEIARCLALPFSPNKTISLMRLDRFQDLPIEEVSMLVRALIIDVDGTLIKPGMDRIPQDVMKRILAIRDKMPVCIFSDDREYLPEFEQNGIAVARNVPQKKDPRSFDVAIQLFLQHQNRSNRMLYASQCGMAGDNFLTDGVCRDIGMQFVHVQPLTGRESRIRTLTRNFADGVARFHDRFRRKKNPQSAPPAHISLPHGK